MPRQILMILIALAVTTVSANDEIRCNPDGNQIELNACARDDFSKADSELNKTYQALIKKEADDKLFISKLRLAQKAWLAFRDAELDARFACAESDVRVCWGSMYPMLFLSRKAELTRERNKQLLQMLKDGPGE
jgi:uncharacterized protein YecT (DUF1311 family)